MRAAAFPPVLMALAALAPGGCGATAKKSADRFSGREKEVAQTVDDLVKAAGRRDSAKICDGLLTPALKARLDALARTSRRGTGCADQLKDSLQDVDSLDLKVVPGGIRITGDSAVVRVRTDVNGSHDPVDTLRLVDQRGWRIAELP
jgi:hypothetical protein